MDLEIVFDEHDLFNEFGEMEEGAKQAMKATRSDFRTRHNAKVVQAITSHYNISASRVRKEKPRWENTGEYSGEAIYSTSPIGVGNFGMTPRVAPSRAGMRRQFVPKENVLVTMPAPYSISFSIKNAAATLPSNAGFFIRKDRPGEAWRRVGASPDPIEKVNTLSVSAMINNDAKSDLEKMLEELVDTRLAHNLERFCG